ncbi:MAG: hypothetical protein JXB07_04835 [Anaerolineae bacterium]|nr:hypothetical protein [Anaerolineae bacterium]
MHKKTGVYGILIMAILACGPCVVVNGTSVSETDMTNIANITAYAMTTTPQLVSTGDWGATQFAMAVQSTLTAMAPMPDEPTVEPGRDSSGTGTATGGICFPSEGVPAVTVYAQNTADNSLVRLDYPGGWGDYVFPGIPPGDYVFFAYPEDESITMAGGYTQAVLCGLGAECTDHSLIVVHIEAGVTVEGVDICDWYAPDGSFPPRP